MNTLTSVNKDPFPRAIGVDEVNKFRKNEDLDIVKRLGFLKPEKNNY